MPFQLTVTVSPSSKMDVGSRYIVRSSAEKVTSGGAVARSMDMLVAPVPVSVITPAEESTGRSNSTVRLSETATSAAPSAGVVLCVTRAKVAQFMLIYSMSGRKNELDKYMDYPSSRTRISVRSSETR